MGRCGVVGEVGGWESGRCTIKDHRWSVQIRVGVVVRVVEGHGWGEVKEVSDRRHGKSEKESSWFWEKIRSFCLVWMVMKLSMRALWSCWV